MKSYLNQLSMICWEQNKSKWFYRSQPYNVYVEMNQNRELPISISIIFGMPHDRQ